MIINLELYSTSHCHLCDQAESLLLKLNTAYQFEYQLIDIVDDANLYSRYQFKIPVLKRLDTGNEICWPFDESAIKSLLTKSKSDAFI